MNTRGLWMVGDGIVLGRPPSRRVYPEMGKLLPLGAEGAEWLHAATGVLDRALDPVVTLREWLAAAPVVVANVREGERFSVSPWGDALNAGETARATGALVELVELVGRRIVIVLRRRP